jgi:hypothetical protein
MPPRRVDVFDKIVIAICLMWLLGWTATGFLLATDFFWAEREVDQARFAVNVFVFFAAIGSIALIGLWPHRWLLRRDEPDEPKGHGFEVRKP